MGGLFGGGKRPSQPPVYLSQSPSTPTAPTIDQAEAERLKREQKLEGERQAKRKAAIETSGRGSTILAGETLGDSGLKTLLGE